MSGLRKIVTAWRSGGSRTFGEVADGANGTNGWTPVLLPEQDGTRTLLKVADWVNGSGAKPEAGMYLGAGAYVATKAAAFNFNSAKRVMLASAQTNGSGVAAINYVAAGFTIAPVVIALPATTAVLSGATRSTVSAITATGCTVTVQQQAVLTGIVSLLTGATANVLVIEQ